MHAAGRLEVLAGHVQGGDAVGQLAALRTDLWALCDELNCNPILIRLAWHDSGTFDRRIAQFPQRGGANGAIRFDPELTMGANAGLAKAVKYLEPLKQKYPLVGWADCIQMASAVAVEHAGGPRIPMTYGRKDAAGPGDCVGPTSREGFAGNAGLPDALPGPDGSFGCGAKDPAAHLRNVFGKKMGFSDAEIVALSGAHTLGRAFKERSGTCPFGYGAKSGTTHTSGAEKVRKDGKEGVGMAGGQSWTSNWLTFDNSYFRPAKDPQLLWFPTDACLATDPAFKPHFEQFGKDQQAFFAAYAQAHKKLSELGTHFEPKEGLTL